MATSNQESLDLMGFVMTHQYTFEAIKRASDDPTDENILDMQRSIRSLVERERANAREQLLIWLLGIALAAAVLWRFL